MIRKDYTPNHDDRDYRHAEIGGDLTTFHDASVFPPGFSGGTPELSYVVDRAAGHMYEKCEAPGEERYGDDGVYDGEGLSN